MNRRLSCTGMKNLYMYIKSHTILTQRNCLVLCTSTNERWGNVNCNEKEAIKAILFTYGYQKPPKRFFITYKSNDTCEKEMRTSITMAETCAATEN